MESVPSSALKLLALAILLSESFQVVTTIVNSAEFGSDIGAGLFNANFEFSSFQLLVGGHLLNVILTPPLLLISCCELLWFLTKRGLSNLDNTVDDESDGEQRSRLEDAVVAEGPSQFKVSLENRRFRITMMRSFLVTNAAYVIYILITKIVIGQYEATDVISSCLSESSSFILFYMAYRVDSQDFIHGAPHETSENIGLGLALCSASLNVLLSIGFLLLFAICRAISASLILMIVVYRVYILVKECSRG